MRRLLTVVLSVLAMPTLLVSPSSMAAAPPSTTSVRGTAAHTDHVHTSQAQGEVCGIGGPAGVEWTSRVSAADNDWQSVAWGGPPGGELFVAVASGASGNPVMTSPDGVTWTERAAPIGDWSSVTWGNGLFVAAARFPSGYRVMTSPDGMTWTYAMTPPGSQYSSVTWGGPVGQQMFVVVAGLRQRPMIGKRSRGEGLLARRSSSPYRTQGRAIAS